MPLTDDQRAMLQLLLQRGQSYDDIASLLGLDVEQVRSRARAALAEIGGEDPDREVGLTDYLLGQADPIGRADVARHLQADGDTRELADRLVTQLRVLAPGAELPELPAARPARRKRSAAAPPARPEPPAAPASGAPGGVMSTLSRRQRQLMAGLVGGGLLVLLLVILVATGAFSGGGSSPGSDSSSTQVSNASGPPRAILAPQNGSRAQGVAVFARVRNTPVLQVNVVGLKPSAPGQSYVIWLYGSQASAFPLSSDKVGSNGQLRGAVPVPIQLLQALQQGLFDSIDVSLTRNSQVVAALRQARSRQQLPPYSGQSIVRGTITGPGFPAGGSAGSSG